MSKTSHLLMKPNILSLEINDYLVEHSFPIVNGKMESHA